MATHKASNMKRQACFLCQAPRALGGYPNAICDACDGRAIDANGGRPWHASDRLLDPRKPRVYRVTDAAGRRICVINVDTGDAGCNPVFIDGIQCWRRYRFGGWITMADPDRFESLDRFYESHRRLTEGDGFTGEEIAILEMVAQGNGWQWVKRHTGLILSQARMVGEL